MYVRHVAILSSPGVPLRLRTSQNAVWPKSNFAELTFYEVG
jgi:hypothetical protein